MIYPQKNTLAQYFERFSGVPDSIVKYTHMKNTITIMGTLSLSLLTSFAKAQETKEAPVQQPQVQTWDARKNPTVDSISSKYRDKIVAAPVALTTADIFPVIGTYESSTNPEAASLNITLDMQNKGIAWIEGLPQGKVKALLMKSPATYKIPVQKTEGGKDVAEGTLIFDKDLNTLSICLGKEYNTENPSAAFTQPAPDATMAGKTAKAKKETTPKPWIYTGSKVVKTTAMNNMAVK